MKKMIFALWMLLIFTNSSFAIDRSDFKLDYVVADFGHGCQYYTVDAKSLLADTYLQKPKVSIAEGATSHVENGEWEILANRQFSREVWIPDVVCEESKPLKNGTTTESCVDNGRYETQYYTEEAWQPMDSIYKFKVGEEAKLRYCADYEMKKLPEGGWGAKVDVIPEFAGYRYEEYAWWNVTWDYRHCWNLTNGDTIDYYDHQVDVWFDVNGNGNGSDVRWTWLNTTSSSEQEIDHWKRANITDYTVFNAWNYSNGSGLMVVEVPEIPMGTNTSQICGYYGGSGIAESSSVTDTFIFADDFVSDTTGDYTFTSLGKTYNATHDWLQLSTSSGTGMMAKTTQSNITNYSTEVDYVNLHLGNILCASGYLESVSNKLAGYGACLRTDYNPDRRFVQDNSIGTTDGYANQEILSTIAYQVKGTINSSNGKLTESLALTTLNNGSTTTATYSYTDNGGGYHGVHSNNGAGLYVAIDNFRVRKAEPVAVVLASAGNDTGSGGGGGTITPLDITIQNPLNDTYSTPYHTIEFTCGNTSGGNESYYANVTANGATILDNQVVSNNTAYSFVQDFGTNGNWQLNVTCTNGSYTNTSNDLWFTMAMNNPIVSAVSEALNSYNYLSTSINFTATVSDADSDLNYTNISIYKPSGAEALASTNLTFLSGTTYYYNATSISLDEIGTWTVAVSGVDSNINIASNTTTFSIAKTINESAADGYYGLNLYSLNTTAEIDALLSSYQFDLLGHHMYFENISDNWTNMKNTINHTFDVHNAQSFMHIRFGDTNYSDATDACTDVNAYFTDIASYPFTDAIAFIVIETNPTGLYDISDFISDVATCMMGATDNSFPIYSTHQNESLDGNYVSNWTMIRISDKSNLAETVYEEAAYFRNSTELTRIYEGNSTGFLNHTLQYHNNIITQLRSSLTGTNQPADVNVSVMENEDFICYNNASTERYMTFANTGFTNGSDIWDFTKKTLNMSVDNSTGIPFTVGGYGYNLVFVDSFDQIIMDSDNTSTLYKAVSDIEDERNYTDVSTGDGSYVIQGAADVRINFVDPSYVKDHTFFLTYEELAYSYNPNMTSDDNLWIIAHTDATNTPANYTATFGSDASLLSKIFGYVSVADYNNTLANGSNRTDCSEIDPWETDKKGDIDDWLDFYTMGGVFIDGFDIGYASTPACFEESVTRIMDYAEIDKGSETIANTYTIYTEIAHKASQGVMRESCFARWDGAVGAPVYSYEDIGLMSEHVNYTDAAGITVYCMAFGDAHDYDKMAYTFAAFSVWYGADGNNLYYYGQPTFQVQIPQYVPDIGSMMQNSYQVNNATDHSRRYSNGVMHFDPTRTTTFPNGKYYYWETNEQIDSLAQVFHFQIYGACTSSSPVYVILNTTDSTNTFTVNPCVDIGTVVWTMNSKLFNITDYAVPNGHYDWVMYAQERGWATGTNVINSANTQSGVYSYYDNTASNPPTTDAGWTAYARTGVAGNLNSTNWKGNLTIVKSERAAVDSEITDITYSILDVDTTERNITFAGTKEYEINVMSPAITLSFTPDTIIYNGTSLNTTNSADCSDAEPTFNTTTANGHEHGVCLEGTTVRFLMPKLTSDLVDSFSITYEVSTGSVVYFISPTPENASNITSNTIQIALNSSVNMTSCNIEIGRSTNNSGTVDSTNQTCFYNITPTTHGTVYSLRGFAEIAGSMAQSNESNRTFTWYDMSECSEVVDAFDIYSSTSEYIEAGYSFMNVTANITLNNTCPVAVNLADYNISDSNADSTMFSYTVNLTANELKNFTGFDFRIPINFTYEGETYPYEFFNNPSDRHYKIGSSYSRNVSNIYVNLSTFSDDTNTLYSCEGICAFDNASWTEEQSVDDASGILQTTNDMPTGGFLEYIISYIDNGGGKVNAGGGGAAGVIRVPQSAAAGANETNMTAAEEPDEAPEKEETGFIATGLVILFVIFVLWAIRRRAK